MKKIILSACMLAASFAAFAQQPKQGDHSMTFGATGINFISVGTTHPTGTLLFRHFIKDDMAVRAGINFGTSKSTTVQAGYVGDSIDNSSKSSGWALSLGIQKNLKGTAKLNPYIGVDLVFGGGNSSSSNSTKAGTMTTVVDSKNGATSSFGLMPCLGFNYFLADWLAIGAEFSWGYTMSSTKAGTNTTSVTTGSTTTTTKSETPKTTSGGFGTSGTGMVTVTVAFNH